MFKRRRYRRRCQDLASECESPVLAGYMDACGRLNIGHVDDTPLIAVDLELTGLDPRMNRIIAMGWTQVDQGRIRMGTNQHLLINADQTVGPSAAIHELMDSDVAQGMDLGAGLEALFGAAEGRIWVFHHAPLDIAFLRRACMEWMGVKPPFAVLDTLQIELALRKRRNLTVKQGDLQLGKLRGDYHLPRYTAHDALIDAVATAELLLAMAARRGQRSPLDLASIVNFI